MSTKKTTKKPIFISSTFCDIQAEHNMLLDSILKQANELVVKTNTLW